MSRRRASTAAAAENDASVCVEKVRDTFAQMQVCSYTCSVLMSYLFTMMGSRCAAEGNVVLG